jgi:hypothetical protein
VTTGADAGGLDEPTDPGDLLDPLETAAPAVSRAKRVRSILIRLVFTVAALVVAGIVLATVFEDLDRDAIVESLRSLTDAERIALASGTAMMFAAQGLVTSSTIERLPVRRGVLAFLGPAAVASVIPGPSDLPVRYRMYSSWGYTPAESALAVTASGIFSIGTKLVMPVLAVVVAVIAGIGLSDGVMTTIVIAGVVLGVLILLTAAALGSPRVTHAVGAALQAPWELAAGLLKRESGELSQRLLAGREQALDLLQSRWQIATWATFLYSAAQIGLMVMAIRFMGVPAETLGVTEIFVAFGIVQGLTVLPVTAGNVGVAETGWITLLSAMAGSGSVNQITAAVLIFRILTWLAVIPLGGISILLWRRGLARRS